MDYPFKDVWHTIDSKIMYGFTSVDTSKPALILVHGLSVSSIYMLPLARECVEAFSIYAPDLPGFGKSEAHDHILSLHEQTDMLIKWMDIMQIKKAVFLGNSLGCQIIINLSLRYPERISHAILVGPTVDQKAKSYRQQLFRLLLDLFSEPLSYIPIACKEYVHAGISKTIKTFYFALKQNELQDVQKMSVPTLIVRGEKDPIVSQDWVHFLQKHISNSKLVVIPNAGHVVNYNSPKKLTACLYSFLGVSLRTRVKK